MNSVSISPDNKYFLTGSFDSTVKLWGDKEFEFTDSELEPIKGLKHPIASIAISLDTKFLVAGTMGNSIEIWKRDLESKTPKYNKHQTL